ncbi:MAG: nucleoside transporter [Candidatus Aminicenantes bacterium RBG_13_63_10]|nr:MAG: nucleoside transporter [Candidatus Aminicenantes bacterium RBG_13_63_10]
MGIYNLVSFGGIFAVAGLAWLCSRRKRVVNWRVVLGGIGLQLLIALFIFVVPAGRRFFLFINTIVVKVLESAVAGSSFLFGRLALPPGVVNEAGETSLGYFLIFQALPTIIFFAALVSALYYLRVMPLLVKFFARLFSRTLRVSGAESLCVSSEIFVGVESSLVVRPYLMDMTRSELVTIMTAGMATIASSVLATYVIFLQRFLPTIAGHLVSASFLAAPAALVTSKLVFPETDEPKTMGVNVQPHYEREDNFVTALINGGNAGLRLLGGIAAMLMAFLGLLALLDLVLGWFGGHLNSWLGWHVHWSLKSFLGYLFYPVTLAIGVPPVDAMEISRIIGERTVATELVSYQHLANLMAKGTLVHARSALVASYALCGFAHVASLAIFVGGYSALVPGRVKDISRLAFRALLAATLACLMTAAVAGTFLTDSSILLGK